MATFNYVDENGEVQEIEVNANDIQALDVEGYYDNKNLEDILETLGEANRVYLVENEEQIKKGKAGVYFCDDILDNREDNNVVKRIKDYLNLIAGDLNNLKTNDKTNLVNAINENTSYLKDCANNIEKSIKKLIPINDANIDATVENGIYRCYNPQLGFPAGYTKDSDFFLINYNTSDRDPKPWVRQTLYDIRSNRVFIRSICAGVINPWQELSTVDDTGWIDLPLASGITADGNLIPKCRKVNNQVFICGSILGIDSTNKVVATLPVGFRPQNNHYYASFKNGFATNAINIYPDGGILVQGNSSNVYNPSHYLVLGTNFII